MSDWFQDTALSGSMVLALPVALLAGLISFFSPCVIPLLPGYLSYATGLSGADLEGARRSRLVTGAVLFVLGFSVVFVLLGSLTGAAGAWLFLHKAELNLVLGIIRVTGSSGETSAVQYVGYLIGALFLLPAAVVWSLAERTRAGTSVLLVGILLVPFIFYRLAEIWVG